MATVAPRAYVDEALLAATRPLAARGCRSEVVRRSPRKRRRRRRRANGAQPGVPSTGGGGCTANPPTRRSAHPGTTSQHHDTSAVQQCACARAVRPLGPRAWGDAPCVLPSPRRQAAARPSARTPPRQPQWQQEDQPCADDRCCFLPLLKWQVTMDSEPSPQQAKELQSFMEMEQQKATIQAMIGKLTEACFDKCVATPGAKLDSTQQACVANCAGRYLDSSMFLVNRMMARQRQQ
jgi:import inner membrane translocase subunit TIM8